ncbi:MAG: hypothetical protein C5B48_04515 [Candidatus Rokuibacteriota bacterium]|nr:MAG: hypothetical protein C5B48_04515 [Candidatus Rokubacteria bacterium]
MRVPVISIRKWTRIEYERLVEAAILGLEDRIESLGGEIIVKEPHPSGPANRGERVRVRLGREAADASGS